MCAHASKSTGESAVGQWRKPRGIQQSMVGQAFQADHQHIAGESRGTGIRRIAVAYRAERQNLPQGLLGGRQPVDELIRRRAKISDTTARRERGGMQQNPG